MKRWFSVVAFLVLLINNTTHCLNITNAQHDPFAQHTTFYPFDFLNQNQKEYDKGLSDQYLHERIRFSAMGYTRRANRARNQDNVSMPAGDVHGRWNMIGLLYGNVPTGKTSPALLTTATGQTYQDGRPLTYDTYSDSKDLLGHFTVPLKYRKKGVRFNFSARVFEDMVFTFESGVADVQQRYKNFIDATSDDAKIAGNPEVAAANVYGQNVPAGVDANLATDIQTVDQFLMRIHEDIFTQMNLNIKDYHESGVEDAYLSVAWRHNFHVNMPNAGKDPRSYVFKPDSDEWSRFIFTPFFKLTGILAIGKAKDESVAFSIPFGNNKHHGVSITSGLSVDFYDSIEVSFAAGTSHFFERTIAGMFIPTHEKQTRIFPFSTDVKYDPGKTWFFTCGMNAQHIISKLSCHFEYTFASHSKDTIKLVTPDSAYKPEVLEEETKWLVQGVTMGFNYDISPFANVGFIWQAPASQRGAYKGKTLGFSFAGTF